MNITITHPEVASQWHPTKNGNLNPENFSHGSNVKVWWLCEKITCSKGCLHEWESTINNRCNKLTGCSYCNKKKCCVCNSIAFTHPEVASQWHPTKNGNLKPENFSYGSNVKVWWLCEITCPNGCLHEWKSAINSRCGDRSTGCSYCSGRNCCIHDSIVFTHPEVASQWDKKRNDELGLNPENLSSGSGIKAYWICKRGHSKFRSVQEAVECYCQICSNEVRGDCEIEDSILKCTQLMEDWNRCKKENEKLGLCPGKISLGSSTKAYFKCKNEHKTYVRIQIRVLHKCRLCVEICDEEKSLFTKFPELMKEWDYSKNIKLDPKQINIGTHKKAWWKCQECEYKWEADIHSRVRGNGCPNCKLKTERKVGDWLKNKNIPHERGFNRSWCKHKRNLPFDFCLIQLKIILEIDGAHHFPILKQPKHFRIRDNVSIDIFKMKKALENGYKIIRIYWDDIFKNNEKWLDDHVLSLFAKNFSVTYLSSIDKLYDDHYQKLGLETVLIFNN